MKKFIAILLTLMLLCLSAGALAQGDTDVPAAPTYTDMTSVTVTKVYKLEGAGSSPAETFTLEQVGDGVVKSGEATTAPALGTIRGAEFNEGAASADGAEANITITLPTYTNVGVYEYTLQEVAGNTAGVTYYGEKIRLVVTVINDETGNLRVAAVHTESDGAKSDTFANTYSAGTLNVTKTVTGNLGDKSQFFEFKVKLTGEEGKTYANSYTVSGGSYDSNPSSIEIGEETTFHLKHGETLSIANLPYGVSYTVTETEAEGYSTTKEGDSGSITAATQTAAFTNDRTTTVDTGITTDSLPYVLLLGIVVLAGAVLFIKRRANNG